MPSSAWFTFRKVIESVKKDFPKNFLDGPVPADKEAYDQAILTWDNEAYIRIVFLCTDEPHYKLFKEGKIHRHMRDGLWYIISSESPVGDGEVVSQ